MQGCKKEGKGAEKERCTPLLSQIVEADEGGKEEDYARLRELIALLKTGFLAQDQQAEDTYHPTVMMGTSTLDQGIVRL